MGSNRRFVSGWRAGLTCPASQLVWIADDSPGQPVGLARGLSFWSDLDAQDLALPGAEAEPLVGDVERSVRADCHAGRERQARDDRLGVDRAG